MTAYDVFLSHSSANKAVKEIAKRLRDETGLRLFFDAWHSSTCPTWYEREDRKFRSRVLTRRSPAERASPALGTIDHPLP